MPPSALLPDVFALAVAGLRTVKPRPEIQVETLPPPQRLAPFSHALGATVLRNGDEVATGHLVLLCDPAGHDGWDGTMRLVSYVSADLEPELVNDPLLAAVSWSWLTDALDAHGAQYTAIAGTVTQTVSTRFGDLVAAPPPPAARKLGGVNTSASSAARRGYLPDDDPTVSADIELRASWTPLQTDLTGHLEAWYSLLASTVGLPPPGVTPLPR